MNDYVNFLTENVKHNRVGYCEFFNTKPFLEAAAILVSADEPLRALNLLDNLPGFYRDNVPLEVVELKNKILKELATPSFYMGNYWDSLIRPEIAKQTVEMSLRGQKIFDDIKKLNEQNITPHVVDLGPGEYWLPIGLFQKQALFTYHAVGLSKEAKDKAMPHMTQFYKEETPTDRPVIFVACELIEHLHHEEDIAADCFKICQPDIIHMSTPLYTYDGQVYNLDWEKKGALGHLRTYTPQEFYNVVTKMFPMHKFEIIVSPIMHLRGEKK